MIALSPDGRNLVTRVGQQGVNKLWLRPIERVSGMTLPGTEGASFPFWSPDGRYIGFFAENKLKKIDIFGAPPETLTDIQNGRGGTWNHDGVMLFAPSNDGPLFRVQASGGQPVQVTELDKSRGETAHRQPRFLPDGIKVASEGFQRILYSKRVIKVRRVTPTATGIVTEMPIRAMPILFEILPMYLSFWNAASLASNER
jgi:hypothetical protein